LRLALATAHDGTFAIYSLSAAVAQSPNRRESGSSFRVKALRHLQFGGLSVISIGGGKGDHTVHAPTSTLFGLDSLIYCNSTTCVAAIRQRAIASAAVLPTSITISSLTSANASHSRFASSMTVTE